MSDGVRWIKLAVGMHDDEKIKLLDSMEGKDAHHYVWVRLLIQAAKTNARGKIYLSEDVPYTNEMLSIIFNRPIEVVEASLKVMADLKMIHIDERNFITVTNWEKHQNVEGMEKIREQNRQRAKKFRAKNKSKEVSKEAADNDKADGKVNDKSNNVSVTKQNKKENENKKKNKSKNETETEKNENSEIVVNNNNCNLVEKPKVFVSKVNDKEEIKSAADIMAYIKKISEKIVKISLSAIKAAVLIHGVENVKLAVDEAVEANKLRMNYINGILRNWQAEGYPDAYKKLNNSGNGYKVREYKKLSFNNFEARVYDYDALEKGLLGW